MPVVFVGHVERAEPGDVRLARYHLQCVWVRVVEGFKAARSVTPSWLCKQTTIAHRNSRADKNYCSICARKGSTAIGRRLAASERQCSRMLVKTCFFSAGYRNR